MFRHVIAGLISVLLFFCSVSCSCNPPHKTIEEKPESSAKSSPRTVTDQIVFSQSSALTVSAPSPRKMSPKPSRAKTIRKAKRASQKKRFDRRFLKARIHVVFGKDYQRQERRWKTPFSRVDLRNGRQMSEVNKSSWTAGQAVLANLRSESGAR